MANKNSKATTAEVNQAPVEQAAGVPDVQRPGFVFDVPEDYQGAGATDVKALLRMPLCIYSAKWVAGKEGDFYYVEGAPLYLDDTGAPTPADNKAFGSAWGGALLVELIAKKIAKESGITRAEYVPAYGETVYFQVPLALTIGEASSRNGTYYTVSGPVFQS